MATNKTTKPRQVAKTPAPAPAATPASAPAASAGLPRWVLVLIALVPVLGLLWTVASHFIPKAEPAKSPAPVPPAASAPPTATVPAPITVTVGGSGNVGVGVNNGSIHNGAAKP